MAEKSFSNMARILALVVLIIGLVWFLYTISWVIQLVVISLLIVYVLFPIAEFLKARFRFSHFFAVVATFAFFVITILSLIGLVIPILQREIEDILSDLPYYANQLQFYMAELVEYLETFNLGPELQEAIMGLTTNLQPIMEEVATISISVLSSFVDIFFIFFIVFYLLYDFHSVRSAIINIVPQAYHGHAEKIINIIDLNFGSYIRGNIVRCAIVGLLTGSVLYIIGMPYALLLGILAGVLNIILYIGPYLAAIPAVIFSISPLTPPPFVIVVAYVVIQVIDGALLAPYLLGRAVKLKPITVIVGLLIGQQLAGFLGMILSTPFAGIARGVMMYIQEENKS